MSIERDSRKEIILFPNEMREKQTKRKKYD